MCMNLSGASRKDRNPAFTRWVEDDLYREKGGKRLPRPTERPLPVIEGETEDAINTETTTPAV